MSGNKDLDSDEIKELFDDVTNNPERKLSKEEIISIMKYVEEEMAIILDQLLKEGERKWPESGKVI